jgi:hypothetical protein
MLNEDHIEQLNVYFYQKLIISFVISDISRVFFFDVYFI